MVFLVFTAPIGVIFILAAVSMTSYTTTQWMRVRGQQRYLRIIYAEIDDDLETLS